MVRGGPANRAVKRAKIFALTKVCRTFRRLLSPYFFALPCTWCLHTGVSRKSQELLQFGRSSCTQSLAVRVQRETAEEEGHEICELVGDKAVVVC